MKKKDKVSFEIAHVYAGMDRFEAELTASLDNAKKWIQALENLEPGTTYIKIVFVDDYSIPAAQSMERAEVQDTILKEASKRDIELDYIAFESDCAKYCHYILSDLAAMPRKDQGSHQRSDFNKSDLRLDFEYVSTRIDYDAAAFVKGGMELGAHELRKDIGIQIGLGRKVKKSASTEREMVWSCPAAAAWWQLIRLGILETAMFQEEPNVDGAPLGTWKRPDLPKKSFVCSRTLTLLSYNYIGVEHSVRVILSNLDNLDPTRRNVDKIEQVELDEEPEFLRNISYIFSG